MNILLIDDEASLRRTLRTALDTMGHHVGEAKDGTQALELLAQGRLDDVLTLGRPAEVQLLGQGHEVAQLA